MNNWDITKLTGKIIKIDLTHKEISIEKEQEESYRKFLGGRGLNQLFLFRSVRPIIAPYHPENTLLFGAGLLAGTSIPSSIRLSVDTKNAFTNGIGSANCCGKFARELKFAGFGNIFITGKAEEPVFISINDNDISIRDAKKLWGKTVSATTDAIRAEMGEEAGVLCIGPAGENLVRGACVIVDKARAAAKCGSGAVMGSKNLKAIVVRGSGVIEVANREDFSVLSKKALEKIKKSGSTKKLGEDGTLSSGKSKNDIGAIPLKHYQYGFMELGELEKLDKSAFKKYEQNRFSAPGCPINCRSTYKIDSGVYAGTIGEAMEANTVQDFGYKLSINYPPGIIRAHILCDEYGMDMDTVAESLSWAYECYERKIIDEKDTNGLKLTWGDHETIIKLIENIAKRKDFGNILAEGVKRAAEIIGKDSQEIAMNMKGQDLYETIRMPRGYGLGAALSTRGGGHCSGSPLTEFHSEALSPEIAESVYGVRTAGDPSAYEGKAELVAYHERLHAVLNSLGMCFFATVSEAPNLLTWQDLAEIVSAATGWKVDAMELMEIGERIHTLERCFNAIHAGFDRKDDYPPKRFFCEPINSGPNNGEVLNKHKFDEMLNENYSIHGWNENGLPEKERLLELGLSHVVMNELI